MSTSWQRNWRGRLLSDSEIETVLEVEDRTNFETMLRGSVVNFQVQEDKCIRGRLDKYTNFRTCTLEF